MWISKLAQRVTSAVIDPSDQKLVTMGLQLVPNDWKFELGPSGVAQPYDNERHGPTVYLYQAPSGRLWHGLPGEVDDATKFGGKSYWKYRQRTA